MICDTRCLYGRHATAHKHTVHLLLIIRNVMLVHSRFTFQLILALIVSCTTCIIIAHLSSHLIFIYSEKYIRNLYNNKSASAARLLALPWRVHLAVALCMLASRAYSAAWRTVWRESCYIHNMIRNATACRYPGARLRALQNACQTFSTTQKGENHT